jgi:glutamate dehydrogenase/leucine dehydrogenase
MHGLYRTAEDVGSTTEDMLTVSERTSHVVGLPEAGGVIYLDLEAKHLGSREQIMDRVAAIGDTLRRVFDEAQSRGVTPLEAAEGLAAERLAAGARQHAFAG